MIIYEPTLSAHVTDSTTDNTTIKSEAAPEGARGFVISVKSNAVYVTLDDSNPSSTNGIYIPAETGPIFLPIVARGGDADGQRLRWISSDAAGSAVSILWLR